jgi:hypothetical protein
MLRAGATAVIAMQKRYALDWGTFSRICSASRTTTLLAKVGGNFVTDIPAAIDSGTGVSGTDRLMTFTLGAHSECSCAICSEIRLIEMLKPSLNNQIPRNCRKHRSVLEIGTNCI